MLGRVLGVGGFGITYLAFDPASGRMCALKEYFPRAWAVRDNATNSLMPTTEGQQEVYRHGRDVFINACHYMVEALEKVTQSYGKTVQDLNWISSHQANQRIIKTIARQTDIPEERFLMNIEQRGNTGSPSCAISLSENLHKVKPGDLVGLTVFGGGYSCGAMLLQF